MTDPAPFETILRLSLLEGFTARHLRRLAGIGIERLPFDGTEGSVPAILRKAEDALESRASGERASRVLEACREGGIRIVPIGTREYPARLAAIPDAPLVLYRLGDGIPGEKTVAVVGSRAPTRQGREFAGKLAFGLSISGWTVASGMARGIDAAAHEGALRGGCGTVAVLGCGVDVLYPPEAGDLRRRILGHGTLVSELPPGTPPLPRYFPARNRIISGISQGVVVAEAPERSGALITARFALEQGREVMAVPGNPLFPHTAGSNRLIRDGAPPVTSAEEVEGILGWDSPVARELGREREILRFLSRPRRIHEISGSLGIPIAELLPCLAGMELRKLLERGAGDYYKKLSVRGGPTP